MIKHFLPCPMIQSNEAFKSLVYLSRTVRDGSRHDRGTKQALSGQIKRHLKQPIAASVCVQPLKTNSKHGDLS